jgi:hypothetical protein
MSSSSCVTPGGQRLVAGRNATPVPGGATGTAPLTTTDFNAVFQGPVNLLPSTGLPASGTLSQGDINNIIKRLQGTHLLAYNGRNGAQVDKKIMELMDSAKKEYDFYYNLYKQSVGNLFDSIVLYNNRKNATRQKAMNDNLDTTTMLNTKLNVLLQIMIGITSTIQGSTTQMNNQLRDLTRQLENRRKAIMQQRNTMSSGEGITKLNKEMVKYTEEKARYTDNLLKMYSVLNIVALGLLVYVFRSSSS